MPQNNDISFWVHGIKPHFKVSDTGEVPEEAPCWTVKIQSISPHLDTIYITSGLLIVIYNGCLYST